MADAVPTEAGISLVNKLSTAERAGRAFPDIGPYRITLPERSNVYFYEFPGMEDTLYQDLNDGEKVLVSEKDKIFQINEGKIRPGEGKKIKKLFWSGSGKIIAYSREGTRQKKVVIKDGGPDGGFISIKFFLNGEFHGDVEEIELGANDGELVIVPMPGEGVVATTTRELGKEESVKKLREAVSPRRVYNNEVHWLKVAA